MNPSVHAAITISLTSGMTQAQVLAAAVRNALAAYKGRANA